MTTNWFTKFYSSRKANIITFLVVSAIMFLYCWQLPWAHTRHHEHHFPLPAHYTLVELSEGETGPYPLHTYMNIRFSKDSVVEWISSREIYDKIFPENQEHIVYTGKEHLGMMTEYKSVVWVYNDWCVLGTGHITNSKVIGNDLVISVTTPPNTFNIVLACLIPFVTLGFIKIWTISTSMLL